MPGYVIVGMQWGDEGKGKIVDFLTENADVVVRYQGGNNAGHTVVVHGAQPVLLLSPRGMLHADVSCSIGNGTVIDPGVLIEELDRLAAAGCSVDGRLRISENAHVIMPYHKVLDGAQERSRGEYSIGTTGRGIGPAYADKANRFGIRMGDLMDAESFKKQLKRVLDYHNSVIEQSFGETPLSYDSILNELLEHAEILRPYICDTVAAVHEALRSGKRVVFEGAQGAMLDVDHGTFPYVTSSATTAGGVFSGAGIGPGDVNGVIGIVKAYSTRVGEGPFPTELHDADGERMASVGQEFGATTGRPRRCGWLDIVQLRRAAMINGITHLVITKPDVLSGFKTIRLCTAYLENGKTIHDFPSNVARLERIEPVYEDVPGWTEELSECRDWEDLPENAKRYCQLSQDRTGQPVGIVSVGQGREQTVVCKDPFS